MWNTFLDRLPTHEQNIIVYVPKPDKAITAQMNLLEDSHSLDSIGAAGYNLESLYRQNALWTEKPNHVV